MKFLSTNIIYGFLILLCINCREHENIPVELVGNYRIFTGDTALIDATGGENNYLEIRKNNTIIFHTPTKENKALTINGNFKFNWENNTLSITWQDDKLPSTLKIEKNGNDRIIWIKERAYVKEKI